MSYGWRRNNLSLVFLTCRTVLRLNLPILFVVGLGSNLILLQFPSSLIVYLRGACAPKAGHRADPIRFDPIREPRSDPIRDPSRYDTIRDPFFRFALPRRLISQPYIPEPAGTRKPHYEMFPSNTFASSVPERHRLIYAAPPLHGGVADRRPVPEIGLCPA